MTPADPSTDPARRTVRLLPTPPQQTAIDATLRAFATASDEIVAAGRDHETASNRRLHHLCYRAVRARHGLSANLAVRAIAHAAARLRDGSDRTPAHPDRLDLDARVLSLQAEGTVSLSTVQGRVRSIRFVPEENASPLSAGHRLLRACLLKEAGTFILHLDLADERVL